MEPLVLSAIPRPLRWHNVPVDFNCDGGSELSIASGAKTDLFFDPAKGTGQKSGVDNAPAVLFEAGDAHFTLSARVEVEFMSTFDAGVLLLRAADSRWAKLCFEYSPAMRPMVVSVVTRGASDDCNSVTIDRSEIYLRVAGLGKALAFHYSTDATVWNLVRHFTLGDAERLSAGFLCQSPTGAGCRCRFSEIRYERRTLSDIRDCT